MRKSERTELEMKAIIIAMAALVTSMSQPVQMDYEPICTPATPDPEIYAMGIESDHIDLNSICGWVETVHEDVTQLSLYTYDGNWYVLEMPTVKP